MYEPLKAHYRIMLSYVVGHRLEVNAVVRLVSVAPHNYAGVVLISLEKSSCAVNVRVSPHGVMAGPNTRLVISGPSFIS